MCGDTIATLLHKHGARLSALFHQFVLIAFLQRRPQDFPAAREAMYVALAFNFFTYVLAVALAGRASQSVPMALIDLTLTAVCLFAAVSVVGHRARFQQSYGALCGATAIHNVITLVVFWLEAQVPGVNFLILHVALLGWVLTIITHVLHYTLEVSLWIAIGLAVVFYIIVINFMVAVGLGLNPPSVDQQLSTIQSVSEIWSRRA